jgi:hypothetical protein
MHHPRFLFALIAFAAFTLLLIGALVFIAVRIASRKDGQTASGMTGCALASLLGCLGLCALAACAVIVFLFAGARVAERAIDRMESPRVHVEPRRPGVSARSLEKRDRAPVHFVFRARADVGDVHVLVGLLREVSGAEPDVSIDAVRDPKSGESEKRIDVTLPVGESEVERIESELRRRWPTVDWDGEPAIEFVGVERDA